ncbi:hypothetical protein CRE_27618 [Caenorhabditis remanei]|uniref:Uncharacterized protein n=1 Tax=Caenorhabditis remanei TaxID=31234 RepID=E3MKJ1_CAERE|nr:hypothetical protein CRE_27618 [Caenorhabditis remanei]
MKTTESTKLKHSDVKKTTAPEVSPHLYIATAIDERAVAEADLENPTVPEANKEPGDVEKPPQDLEKIPIDIEKIRGTPEASKDTEKAPDSSKPSEHAKLSPHTPKTCKTDYTQYDRNSSPPGSRPKSVCETVETSNGREGNHSWSLHHTDAFRLRRRDNGILERDVCSWVVLYRQQIDGNLMLLMNTEEQNFLQVCVSVTDDDQMLLILFIRRICSKLDLETNQNPPKIILASAKIEICLNNINPNSSRSAIASALSRCGRLNRLFCHVISFAEYLPSPNSEDVNDDDDEEKSEKTAGISHFQKSTQVSVLNAIGCYQKDPPKTLKNSRKRWNGRRRFFSSESIIPLHFITDYERVEEDLTAGSWMLVSKDDFEKVVKLREIFLSSNIE